MKEIIEKFISQGEEITLPVAALRWGEKVATFLDKAVSPQVAGEFIGLNNSEDVFSGLSNQLGYLEALSGRMKSTSTAEETEIVTTTTKNSLSNKRVFIVHGHDNEAKQTVSRFIENIGLEPIVLHEQANEGKTVIEKFERHADVAFAVVLLTPDDTGSSVEKPDDVQSRARQNVVMELGYFLGSLGRNRVCALHKGDIEIPSDLYGVLYIEMDDAGAWKNRIAKELESAHIDIDLAGLL